MTNLVEFSLVTGRRISDRYSFEEKMARTYILSIDPGLRNLGIVLASVTKGTDGFEALNYEWSGTWDLCGGKIKDLKKEQGKYFHSTIINRVNALLSYLIMSDGRLNDMQPSLDHFHVIIEKTTFCKEMVYGVLGCLRNAWWFDGVVHILDPRKVAQWCDLKDKKAETANYIESRFTWGTKRLLFNMRNYHLSQHEQDCCLNILYFLNNPDRFQGCPTSTSYLPQQLQASSLITVREPSGAYVFKNTMPQDLPAPIPSSLRYGTRMSDRYMETSTPVSTPSTSTNFQTTASNSTTRWISPMDNIGTMLISSSSSSSTLPDNPSPSFHNCSSSFPSTTN